MSVCYYCQCAKSYVFSCRLHVSSESPLSLRADRRVEGREGVTDVRSDELVETGLVYYRIGRIGATVGANNASAVCWPLWT